MKRYWVIGGKYKSTDFETIVKGSEEVVGPFTSWEQALEKWKKLSEETRSNAMMRYSIASS